MAVSNAAIPMKRLAQLRRYEDLTSIAAVRMMDTAPRPRSGASSGPTTKFEETFLDTSLKVAHGIATTATTNSPTAAN